MADNPEVMLRKLFTSGGANSSFTSADRFGAVPEDEQRAAFDSIRAYSVMLADNMQMPFPASSQLGRAMGAPLADGGQNAYARSPLANSGTPFMTPGNIAVKSHSGGKTAGTEDFSNAGGLLIRAATEGTLDPQAYTDRPIDFSRRRWQTEKMQASWALTTEFLTSLQSTEGNYDQAESRIRQEILPVLASNFEMLALQGDDSLAGGNKLNDLLRSNDGWLKIMKNDGPTLDGGGGNVEQVLFERAIRKVPAHYASHIGDYRWWTNPKVWWDYINYHRNLANGGNMTTDMATRAYIGEAVAPLGIPFTFIPLWPDNDAVVDSGASAPRVAASAWGTGTYSFDDAQKTISLNIGKGVLEIVFPSVEDANVQERRHDGIKVAKLINAAFVASGLYGAAYANVADVDKFGNLILTGPVAGAAETIVIADPAAGAAANAAGVLGFVNGTTSGSAGGALVSRGTSIALAPSWNFVWHHTTDAPGTGSNGLRFYKRFDQSIDSMLFDMYAFVDATIRDPMASVLIENVALMDKLALV